MLNVSEIEKLIGIDGTRSVTHPAPAVSPRSTKRAGLMGLVSRCHTLNPRTPTPATMMPATNEEGALLGCELGEGVDPRIKIQDAEAIGIPPSMFPEVTAKTGRSVQRE
jgi:hypothetical protein